jgi:hypothetical protein
VGYNAAPVGYNAIDRGYNVAPVGYYAAPLGYNAAPLDYNAAPVWFLSEFKGFWGGPFGHRRQRGCTLWLCGNIAF